MTRFPAMNAVAAASAALMLGLASLPAAAVKPVSWNDIANDDKTGQDVLNYGLGLKTSATARSSRSTPATSTSSFPPGASPSAARSSAARKRRPWCMTA